jgi:mannose/fructose/N-acetylgalactosamine-specific phosphotransferase system component IID
MIVIAIIEILLGLILIVCNYLLKYGWKIREGSLILGRYLVSHMSKSGERIWSELEKHAEEKMISERTIKNIIQVFNYLFAMLIIFIGIYYLLKNKWLINPYIILVTVLWIAILGFIPFLSQFFLARRHKSLEKGSQNGDGF